MFILVSLMFETYK